jgi:hypothetical protein
MTKTPTAVFKSRAPHLIEEYEAKANARFEEYKAKAIALKNELGVEQLAVNSGWGDIRVTGYVDPDRNAEPKPGWRRDSKTGFMKPALRTPEGKAIAQRLKGIWYVAGEKPGLPSIVMGDGYMGPFTLKKLGDAWYAYITVPLRSYAADLNEVDVQLWEPAKLSEYFSALEAAEESQDAE